MIMITPDDHTVWIIQTSNRTTMKALFVSCFRGVTVTVGLFTPPEETIN